MKINKKLLIKSMVNNNTEDEIGLFICMLINEVSSDSFINDLIIVLQDTQIKKYGKPNTTL